jgi:hypothetical protein
MKNMKEGIPCGEHRFDSLTKGLNGDVSRRGALKWIGATMVGAVLTTLGLEKAHAAGCSPAGSCGTYQNCKGSSTCFCGNTTKPGKTVCFEDIACSAATACSSNRDCKNAFGKGWKCLAADNCCGFALCVSKCGSGTGVGKKTGPTAARG